MPRLTGIVVTVVAAVGLLSPKQQVEAFVPAASQNGLLIASSASSSSSSTHLSAMPPFIIGPMLKKMREEEEKKKMPLADISEASMEAPGLRVGATAWKWPPIWPYDSETFTPTADLAKDVRTQDMTSLANMMSAGGSVPPVTVDEKDKKDAFNPLQYWEEEVVDVKTELDPQAVEKLTSHYNYYLEDGMSVLELGAAQDSYLPSDLKLSKHVGIGASMSAMSANPRLTEKFVVDLNDAEEEKGVNSDVIRQLASTGDGGEPFDAIITANTVDFLTHPREVFKSAWYLLKPGGNMIVAFSNKDLYTDKFAPAQTKMWKDYTDDQHMWMIGSFFEFSAGDGWENVRGFDISPEDAKSIEDQQGPLSFLKGGESNNLFVVQATKAMQDDGIDLDNPEKSFKSKMWMLPVIESRDKMLVAPRLARVFEQMNSQAAYLGKQVEYLPAVYESLIKMDQFAFTFNMQAQLAVDLIAEPNFNANDEQVLALKMGLGLRTPSEEFWAPVGQLTSGMANEEKIKLLTHIVPCFGSGDPQQEMALKAFVDGLKPTFAYLRTKCPFLSEADVQLLGTELLVSEILKPSTKTTRSDFAAWLQELTTDELQTLLAERKQIALEASNELESYRTKKQKALDQEETEKELIQTQLATARKNRSVEIDMRSGKIEIKK